VSEKDFIELNSSNELGNEPGNELGNELGIKRKTEDSSSSNDGFSKRVCIENE
jgi:hypothetical protein